MYEAKVMLPEEVRHQSLRTAIEAPVCPNEAEEKDLLEVDRLKVVANLQKYHEETRAWGDPKGQTARARDRKSSVVAKPSH
jgi:hypothetical protein